MSTMKSLSALLADYERGRLSRRELLYCLTAVAATPVAGRAQDDVLRAQTLNHVSLIVSDLDRSAAFYQNTFGMTVRSVQDGGVNLAVGDSFVGLYQGGEGARPHVNHFCLGLGGFDPAGTVAALEASGVAAESRVRDGVPQVYCADPDGLRVQLQDVSFCGGIGALGNECA